MKFERLYTVAGRPVEEQIEWKTVPVNITGKDSIVPTVEVPAHWSDNAANILADKYLRKAGVPPKTIRTSKHEIGDQYQPPGWLLPSIPDGNFFDHERSAKQVFHRLAGAWTYHGWKEGYFDDLASAVPKRSRGERAEEYARAFYDEVYWCLAMQVAAPNSPQWFNTGLWWAYSIEGNDSGMWRIDPNYPIADSGQVAPVPVLVSGSYQYPQPHACFLTPTADDLVNEGGIMDTWVREARIFKHGSGSGINASAWRGENERLSGGGFASGVMGWLRIGDSAAGAIHSGGTTRRAAKLVLLDDDHPDLPAFIEWKVAEEYKAAAMYVGSQLLRDYYLGNGDPENDPTIDVPQQMIDRMREGFEPIILGKGFEEAANNTIDGQNSNNSVRVTDAFMAASLTDADWHLKARTTGEVMKTIRAKGLWDDLVRASWACADPGLLFHDTINAWHTCPADGVIKTANPCVEYNFLDGTACNLASLNLVGFLRPEGTIDIERYEHVNRLFMTILDISNSMASFPAKEFAIGTYNYRTTGLGYMNLGALLMRCGLPYDSDEGRALAAAMTALQTGVAYRTSAEMAAELGPFPRWEMNAASFFAVMRKHRSAVDEVRYPSSTEKWHPIGELIDRAIKIWDSILEAKSFRNAQVTLQAPTGTIHLVTDCDTSGIEPDFALVKHKNLAGGGSMRIVNQSIEPALRRLGYSEAAIKGILVQIEKYQEIPTRFVEDSSFYVKPEHRRIFDCVAELEPMAHVKMVAAIQPFLSGASSKTINLPRDATIADVDHVYREAHRLGIKAIAVYRDGSKLAQPLEAAKTRPPVEATETKLAINQSAALQRGERERLPPRVDRGYRQKVRVDGQTFYLRTGEYPDGRIGEIFLDLAGAGSTLSGLAESLAKVISVAIQFGTPVEEVVDALLGAKFEPAGIVELHDDVKVCQSIPDLIARDIAINYLGRDELSHRLRAVSVDTGEAIVALDRRAIAITKGTPTGETCRQANCGGLLVQTGTCHTCSKCGWNEGCG